MRQVFADTNYWIALIHPLDSLHIRACTVSKSLRNSQIVTSEWILTELLNDFAKRGESLREKVVALVMSLRTARGVTIVPFDEATFEDAFASYRERPEKNWSLSDCSSFFIMRQLGISDALTHDRHFEQAGFKALLRETDSVESR